MTKNQIKNFYNSKSGFSFFVGVLILPLTIFGVAYSFMNQLDYEIICLIGTLYFSNVALLVYSLRTRISFYREIQVLRKKLSQRRKNSKEMQCA